MICNSHKNHDEHERNLGWCWINVLSGRWSGYMDLIRVSTNSCSSVIKIKITSATHECFTEKETKSECFPSADVDKLLGKAP